jgi:hypothetical protein
VLIIGHTSRLIKTARAGWGEAVGGSAINLQHIKIGKLRGLAERWLARDQSEKIVASHEPETLLVSWERGERQGSTIRTLFKYFPGMLYIEIIETNGMNTVIQ